MFDCLQPPFRHHKMMGCHFQDRPCRPSLCLRGHYHWHQGGEEGDGPSYPYCDEGTCGSCEHRKWDHPMYLEVARSRSLVTDRCPHCGSRHRLCIDVLRCEVHNRITEAFSSYPGWNEKGCTQRLFGAHIPERLQRAAWKIIRSMVVARDGEICQDCGKDLSSVPSWLTEVHHIVPKARGGSDHPSNLKTLCTMCHRRYTDEMAMARSEAHERGDRFRTAEEFRTGYWSEEHVVTTRNPWQ